MKKILITCLILATIPVISTRFNDEKNFVWLSDNYRVLGNCLRLSGQSMTATEIVKKTDDKFKGEQSGYSVMTMTIVRPSWQRAVEFKSWSKEDDYALTLITAPAREKGQTFLKRKTEMWSWNPCHKQTRQASSLNDVAGLDGL